jgi:hypothetical protein
MRTIWSDEQVEDSEGYWKILADVPSSLLERDVVPYYRLDYNFDFDDSDLREQLTAHLNQTLENDASYTKRKSILLRNSKQRFYQSFWRAPQEALKSAKSYIAFVSILTTTITAILTYLRLSQTVSASADQLTRYVQENAVNITASAYSLFSAEMAASNLTLPSSFLETTVRTLTSQILNQTVDYLRQQSQSLATMSNLNAGVLAMGATTAVSFALERYVAHSESLDKLDEERFTKVIQPVLKYSNEIVEEIALKHSVVNRILGLLNDEGPVDTRIVRAEAIQIPAKDKDEDKDEDEVEAMQAIPVMKPVEQSQRGMDLFRQSNNNDEDVEMNLTETKHESSSLEGEPSTRMLMGRLWGEFDKAVTLEGYHQAKKYLDLISANPKFRIIVFNALKVEFSKISQSASGSPLKNFDIFTDLYQALLVKRNFGGLTVEVFSNKNMFLTFDLFELMDTGQHDVDALIQLIYVWCIAAKEEDKVNVRARITHLTEGFKENFNSEVNHLLNCDTLTIELIRACISLLTPKNPDRDNDASYSYL